MSQNPGPPPQYSAQPGPGASYPRTSSNAPPAGYQVNRAEPAYPGQSPYPGHYGAPQHPPAPQPRGPFPPGQFDAGARFDKNSSMNIPPPPPGTMPNQAQLVAAQQGQVNVSQAPKQVWEASSDGGITTHFD